MFDTFISKYDLFIYIIIFIKIIFVIATVYYKYLTKKSSSTAWLESTQNIKAKTEFIFIALMAILLIYIFNPWSRPKITSETRYLLYLFGWILLFTADWSSFITVSSTYKLIMNQLT
jgi:hypothetical protein